MPVDATLEPTNLLFLMSDEHSREVLGCYGNRNAQTPNLDRLAASGTRFDNAYTPSPICVSARASLATGRWVHDIGTWSSAEPYAGSPPGWGHGLIEDGHRVASIGKLHYRSKEDPNGFDEECLPLHVVNELGWLKGLTRDPLPSYDEGTSRTRAACRHVLDTMACAPLWITWWAACSAPLTSATSRTVRGLFTPAIMESCSAITACGPRC